MGRATTTSIRILIALSSSTTAVSAFTTTLVHPRIKSLPPTATVQRIRTDAAVWHLSTSSTNDNNNNSNNNNNDDDDENDEEFQSLFEKIAQDFLSNNSQRPPSPDFPSLLPPPPSPLPSTTAANPFGTNLNEARSATNPYDDNELRNVLRTHDLLTSLDDDDDDDEYDPSANEEDSSNSSSSDDDKPSFSLQDLIAQTIERIDDENENENENENDKETATASVASETSSSSERKYTMLPSSWEEIPPSLRRRIRNITTIASDIDGTIVTSDQTVHPRTLSALLRLIQVVSDDSNHNGSSNNNNNNKLQHFLLATGKTRAGAMASFPPELRDAIHTHKIPGVYAQGLYCLDGEGNVVFERRLERSVVEVVETLLQRMKEEGGEDSGDAAEKVASPVGYDGDLLYAVDLPSYVTDISDRYNEPMPCLLPPGGGEGGEGEGGGRELSTHPPSFHKLLLLSPSPDWITNTLRPRLEELLPPDVATITQALPTMLEILPPGCSKARGVRALVRHLRSDSPLSSSVQDDDRDDGNLPPPPPPPPLPPINPLTEGVLALGDAENDIGMIMDAGVGVAMGNGGDDVKAVADLVVEEGNDGGGVGVVLDLLFLDFVEEGGGGGGGRKEGEGFQ